MRSSPLRPPLPTKTSKLLFSNPSPTPFAHLPSSLKEVGFFETSKSNITRGTKRKGVEGRVWNEGGGRGREEGVSKGPGVLLISKVPKLIIRSPRSRPAKGERTQFLGRYQLYRLIFFNVASPSLPAILLRFRTSPPISFPRCCMYLRGRIRRRKGRCK